MTYEELRQEMAEKNENMIGTILKPKEKILDEKLLAMKEAFKKECDNIVPFDMPVLRDKRIWKSDLYKFCKALPKGSDLHVHGTALLPTHKLIDFLMTYDYVYIDTKTLVLKTKDSKNENSLLFKDAINKGLVKREDIIYNWTVLGGEKSIDMWQYFEKLFDYTAAIDEDMDLLKAYYIYAFKDYIKCNILHVEIHILLSEDFETTAKIINTVKEAYYIVKKDNPDFVVSLIGAAMKMMDYSMDTTKKTFINVQRAQELIKDESEDLPFNFILGFDLINEEDTSRPLREFAEVLMDFQKEHPDFQYFLHCGESLDPQNDNLIDAYLMGVKRVGHGTNLYRYPYLLKCYADKEICLESCLISNQTLRYTTDIRLHPSAEYLKRGVSISLCSDDPSLQENEQLTDDFFAAIMSWNLGIAEIKQLAINSITFSGLNDERKLKLLKAFRKQWDEFVEEYSD